jgi:hypothetical protein
MMTQTHVLLAAALFARPGRRRTGIAAIAGGLVPDADVWLMAVVEFSAGLSGCEIFHYRYWQQPWISLQALMNSIPLYGGILAAGVLTRWPLSRSAAGEQQSSDSERITIVFALSALLHVGTDLLLHHDDARRQFWPISDWIFRSPVSYWDPNYHGDLFVFFEIALGAGLAAVLWRRFARARVRFALVLAGLAYGLILYASVFGAAVHDKGPGSCDSHPRPYQRGIGWT